MIDPMKADLDLLFGTVDRLAKKVRDLEGRLDEAERTARNALDEAHRLEDRLRYVEADR